MRHSLSLVLLSVGMLLSGCADKKAEIKSNLLPGDKVLIEKPDEIFLSLNNDSLVVRHDLKSNACDTIFNSGKNPRNRRLGVLNNDEHILMFLQLESDSILAASYNLKDQQRNYSSSYGMGIMPYQGTDSVKVVLAHNTGEAIYEASYYIRMDATASPTMALNKEFYTIPKQKAKSSSDDPFLRALFGFSSGDGHQYWWQCTWCHESVKSSGEPPRAGCYRNNGYHVWNRGSRAD